MIKQLWVQVPDYHKEQEEVLNEHATKDKHAKLKGTSPPNERQPLTDEEKFIVFDVYALCMEQTHFQTCLSILANETSKRLSCDRVSIGLMKGKHLQLKTISHSYEFKKESNLIHDIDSAMDEAISQDSLIVIPPVSNKKSNIILHNNRFLSRRHGNQAICTIPLIYKQEVIGAMTLERNIPDNFEPREIRLIELLALMISPAIELKQQEDMSLFAKNRIAAKQQINKLIGPKHATTKLVSLSTVIMLIFFSLFKMEYQVSVDASLEGRVQRVVAAPIDGFISSAEVRAGDVVEKGQLLARLEDKDLKLEHAKLTNQKQQYNKEYRQALALHERAKSTIFSAQIKQTVAQIDLIDKQLARLQIVAPFDGVVIEGDLNQLLGTPVERGQKLYVVAPLDDYRIILNIDERETSFIKPGQKGSLVLPSMPNEVLDFYLQSITPVSITKENRNYFRAEAKLRKPNKHLHPGMKGVAKIRTGEQKLIWIWTHDLIDWLRLYTWSIMP